MLLMPNVVPELATPVTNASGFVDVWTGGAPGTQAWSADFNWSSGSAPAPAYDVIFDNTSSKNNLLDRDTGINSLTVNPGYGGTFSANAGASLEILNGLTMAQVASVTLPFEINASQNQTWRVPEVLGVLTLTGLVHLPSELTVESAGNTIVGGVLSGTGSSALVKTGGGALRLSGLAPNSYSGTTTVNAGTLLLDKTSAVAVPGALVIGDGNGTDTVRLLRPEQIADNAAVTVNAGGKLDLNGQSETIGSLGGDGTVTLGSATLTFGQNGSSTALLGAVTGTGGLTKVGSGGTRLLSTDNAYSGPTTISRGGLELVGALPGPLMLSGGGAVGGTASVGPLTATVGDIGPGLVGSTGTFTAASMTLAQDVSVHIQINAATALGFDHMNVTNGLQLNGARLDVVTTFVPAPSSHFAIVSNGSGAVNGTFANLPEGAAFFSPGPGGGTSYRISYVGGTGNDVVLTAIGPACTPRPRVQLVSQASGGKLQTTIVPGALTGGARNPLVRFKADKLDNASVVVNGRSVAEGQAIGFVENTLSATMLVSRVTGGRPSTVRFTVTDQCGDWPSFVGGGPTAF